MLATETGSELVRAKARKRSMRRVAQDTVWNLCGHGLPAIAAIVSIPTIIAGLGVERYGFINVAWILIGYFSLFDLGLGRALTKLVAEKLETRRRDQVPELVWTAVVLVLVLGLLGSACALAGTEWLVTTVLSIAPELVAEAEAAFRLLVCSIPVVIGTATMRGVLEGYERFDLVNAVRIPQGVFSFIGPLLVIPFSTSLVAVVTVLLLGRLVTLLAYVAICMRLVGYPVRRQFLDRLAALELVRFGGWITVSNVVGPLMTYLDRILLGGMLSMTAVAYYATPYEIVTKVWLIAAAVATVLFPAFTAGFSQGPERVFGLLRRGVAYTYAGIFPVLLVATVFSGAILRWWVGPDFETNGTLVMQILSIGVFLNGLAQVPLACVQGGGQPQITAKLHLLELPLYVILVVVFGKKFGAEGVASAWLARTAIDYIALHAAAARLCGGSKKSHNRLICVVGGSSAVLAIGMLVSGVWASLAYVSVGLVLFFGATWYLLLEKGERRAVAHSAGEWLSSYRSDPKA